MSINLDYTEKICITCGCVYYVPSEVVRIRNEDKTYFYCFNGHAQMISKSTSDLLREKLDKIEEENRLKNYKIINLELELQDLYKPKRRAKRVPVQV